jgi:uncharacterized glyoxalase superfamily protein PhnB/ribosomal protein S18 acetylase RimI-like enzyme
LWQGERVPESLRLTTADAGEVLTLQRAAYVTEAKLHDDLKLPPLHQSLEALREELSDPHVVAFGYRDADGRLVAAVRAKVDGRVADIGRLVVAPDLQRHGYGTRLLTALESHLSNQVAELRLFTGERSADNLRLYRRLGYAETHRSSTPAGYALVHLSKTCPNTTARETLTTVTAIQPELWVDRGLAAVAFYQQAFGARLLHQVGEGEDIVAQLAVDEAVFWVAATGDSAERLLPKALGDATARLLLLVGDPAAAQARAIAAGAIEKSAVQLEHGWHIGRIIDPFGHEWEIGKPVIDWPPPNAS